jgi:hypothetical protein
MELQESYKSKRFNLIQLICFKRCMAFDGRTDPNNGYEEKSPCTSKVLECRCKIIVLIGLIIIFQSLLTN